MLLASAFRRRNGEAGASGIVGTDLHAERPALAPVPLGGAQLPEPDGPWRAVTSIHQRGL